MRPNQQRNAAAERMVKLQLENRDIVDRRVLEAMRRIPRHLFVPAGSREGAYGDFPVPIGYGQTISQPYMVAFMTQALALRGEDRVLEIGTGSGYQAAVLAELCREVFTVELIPELAAHAEETLGSLGYENIIFRTGDGSEGLPAHAPYDRILVTAAAPAAPPALCDQLADNGVIVIPIGNWKLSQVIVVLRRTGGAITTEQSIGCRFVPLLGRGGFED